MDPFQQTDNEPAYQVNLVPVTNHAEQVFFPDDGVDIMPQPPSIEIIDLASPSIDHSDLRPPSMSSDITELIDTELTRMEMEMELEVDVFLPSMPIDEDKLNQLLNEIRGNRAQMHYLSQKLDYVEEQRKMSLDFIFQKLQEALCILPDRVTLLGKRMYTENQEMSREAKVTRLMVQELREEFNRAHTDKPEKEYQEPGVPGEDDTETEINVVD